MTIILYFTVPTDAVSLHCTFPMDYSTLHLSNWYLYTVPFQLISLHWTFSSDYSTLHLSTWYLYTVSFQLIILSYYPFLIDIYTSIHCTFPLIDVHSIFPKDFAFQMVLLYCMSLSKWYFYTISLRLISLYSTFLTDSAKLYLPNHYVCSVAFQRTITHCMYLANWYFYS